MTQHVTLTFTNVVLDAVNIELQRPQWLQSCEHFFILKTHAEKPSYLVYQKWRQDCFRSHSVSTNRSADMLSVNVTITRMTNDQNNLDISLLAMVGILTTLFSLIGMIEVPIIKPLPENHFIKKKVNQLLKKM